MADDEDIEVIFFDADTSSLCDATLKVFDDSEILLRCDYKAGHGGAYHCEQYVARWRREGDPDVKWSRLEGGYVKPIYDVEIP